MSNPLPLTIRDLTVAYDERPALWDIDLDLHSSKLTAIVGPNGAGKSTLLKTVLGFVPAAAGTIRLFGEQLQQVRHRVAYVPQRSSVDWDFPTDVLDVVTMGLYGKIGWLKRPNREHRHRALECLERVGMAEFGTRQISKLSGGQQQRVFLARALAQNADLYLMDEPFAGVDAATEATMLEVLRQLVQSGKTVAVVHHDLETAREYFDEVVLLNVRLIAQGEARAALSKENLAQAYGQRKILGS